MNCKPQIRIKICGITRGEDAATVAAAGADSIGLNFYRPSPRFVTAAQAAEIGGELPSSITRVGVFVDASADEIRDVARHAKLDVIQLHGEEPPSLLAELEDWPVIKAFRCRDPQLGDVVQFVKTCERTGVRPPAWLLLDAYSPRAVGGTGERLDWPALARSKHVLGDTRILLAGGLTADNVAEAIRTTSPAGVDVASGVESSPGKKDPILVRAFVQNATAAFEPMG